MGIKLFYSNKTNTKILSYKKTFSAIAKYAYKYLKLEGDYELSVTLINDELIKEYNAQYRNIDRSTDVLSFALNDEVSGESKINFDEELVVLLGDIFISYETAVRQASEYGHSIDREMAFLFTHGLLHLLGYDHQNNEDEKEMFSLQDVILDALNIKR